METTGHDRNFFFFFSLKKGWQTQTKAAFFTEKEDNKKKKKKLWQRQAMDKFYIFFFIIFNPLIFHFFHFFKKSRLLIEIIIILVGQEKLVQQFIFYLNLFLRNISNTLKTKRKKNKTKRKVRKHDKKKEKKKRKGRFTKIVKTGGFFAMRQSQATIQISTSLQRLLFYPERQETLFLDVSLIIDKRAKNFNFLIQNMGRQEVTGGYKGLQQVTDILFSN